MILGKAARLRRLKMGREASAATGTAQPTPGEADPDDDDVFAVESSAIVRINGRFLVNADSPMPDLSRCVARTSGSGRCRNVINAGSPTPFSFWRVTAGRGVQGYDLDDDAEIFIGKKPLDDPDKGAFRDRWLRQRCGLHMYRYPDAPDHCLPEWREFDPRRDAYMLFPEPEDYEFVTGREPEQFPLSV